MGDRESAFECIWFKGKEYKERRQRREGREGGEGRSRRAHLCLIDIKDDGSSGKPETKSVGSSYAASEYQTFT